MAERQRFGRRLAGAVCGHELPLATGGVPVAYRNELTAQPQADLR